MQQKEISQGSATSVDLGDLPFDMPKLNRRLRAQSGNDAIPNTLDLNNISHASSSLSMRDENRLGMLNNYHQLMLTFMLNFLLKFCFDISVECIAGTGRKNLSLQFNKASVLKNDGMPNDRGLHLNLFSAKNSLDIDTSIPLDRQG